MIRKFPVIRYIQIRVSSCRFTSLFFFLQIQFCIALGAAVHTLYSGCEFPEWMSWALILYMISFLVLFGNFYIQAYLKKKTTKSSSKNGKSYGIANSSSKRVDSENNDVARNGNGDVLTPSKYNLRSRK